LPLAFGAYRLKHSPIFKVESKHRHNKLKRRYLYSHSKLKTAWKKKTSEILLPFVPNLIAMGVLSIWNAMRSLVFAGNGSEVSVGDVMRESSSHNALELGSIGVAEIVAMQLDREFYRKNGIWRWTEEVLLGKKNGTKKGLKENKKKAEAEEAEYEEEEVDILGGIDTTTIAVEGEISKGGSTTKGLRKKKKRKKYKTTTGTNTSEIRGGGGGGTTVSVDGDLGGLGDSIYQKKMDALLEGTTTFMDSSLGDSVGGFGGGGGGGTTVSVGGGLGDSVINLTSTSYVHSDSDGFSGGSSIYSVSAPGKTNPSYVPSGGLDDSVDADTEDYVDPDIYKSEESSDDNYVSDSSSDSEGDDKPEEKVIDDKPKEEVIHTDFSFF
jgi:hypothetical protein